MNYLRGDNNNDGEFNYRNALDKRNQYPLLRGMNKYQINGKVYSGDMWINTILEEKTDTVILVVPKNIMLLQAYKKMREELFSIYYVSVLVDIKNLLGGMIPSVILRLSKTPNDKVKIAQYNGKVKKGCDSR